MLEPESPQTTPSFRNYLFGQPGTLRFLLGVIATVVILAAVPLGLWAVQQQQSTSSDASSSCAEAIVDVQFRKNATSSTPWVSGNALAPRLNDRLDINCFARYGSTLLTHGTITGTLNSQPINFTGNATSNNGVEVRGYLISQPGTYVFTCKNTDNSCNDSDTFVIAGTASPSPSPSSSVSPSPSPSPAACTQFAPSDLNKDCRSSVEDYDIFLNDFVSRQN